MIAGETGRAFYALDGDVADAVDLEDRDDTVEDLVREYVGAIYLAYDVNAEPVADPVERDAPEPPVDFDEIAEMMADAVTVSSDAFAAATAMDDLNDTLAQQLTFPAAEITAAAELAEVHEAQISALAASVQPILEQHDQLMESVAATAAASFTDVLTEIEFPKPVLADLAAIQPTINAAATAAAPSVTAGHARGTSYQSVSPPEPETVDPDEPSISPDPGTVEPVEPTVGPATGAPVAATVDATLPAPEMVSTELIFEVPALIVDCILSTGEVRIWFSELPRDHQNTVVNVMLISAVLSVTRRPTLAALAPFIAPSVRRMIVTDIEKDSS